MFLGVRSLRLKISLQLLSSSAHTGGSGSRGRLGLLSGGRGRATLSGLPDVVGHAVRQPVSLSGGGQRLVTVSQTQRLLAPHLAEQPASVAASAELEGGFVVGARRQLSAVL